MQELIIGSTFILGLTSLLSVGIVSISFAVILNKINTYRDEN